MSKGVDFGYKSEAEMFFDLWNKAKEKGDIICPFTKRRLNHLQNTRFIYNCFAHILPKGRFPYWKLNPDNIRIVFPEFHRIVDRGTTKDRSMYPEWNFEAWDKLYEEKKKEYEQFKINNQLS